MTLDIKDIRHEESIVGPNWSPVYQTPAPFLKSHFENAMLNIIRHPNVNSTVIMRADILKEETVDESGIRTEEPIPSPPSIDPVSMPLIHNLDDITGRDGQVDSSFLRLSKIIIRRIVPRNPLRDSVINQSCLIYNGVDDESDTMLIVYLPHLLTPDACPYYLPPVQAVGILYHEKSVSLHYVLFNKSSTTSLSPSTASANQNEVSNIQNVSSLIELDNSDRAIRIALHLLQTCHKHSNGVMNGYKKRVHHDLVVEKVAFQDRYMELKHKYAKELVANWVENTDPKKHVFEDLAIAAFLIELWTQMYARKNEFCFYDLGCGNGLLVYILITEGYQGKGIDARARKSWYKYPAHVQSQLQDQVIVPQAALRKNEGSDDELLKDPSVNLLNLPKNTFVIGNHSDELTVWIPLLGYPFMVIPCCSHAISGAKYRFTPRDPKNPDSKSSYASLVDHVEDISTQLGWEVEKEMLRIPSTRNAAIIGRKRDLSKAVKSVEEIIQQEGGTEGWIERTMSLRSKSPRNH